MGFRIAFLFVILADAAVIPASAQQQLGQSCHSGLTDPLHGLYCTVIHSSFVPQQGTAYSTSIEVLNGQITPVMGSLTFAPGPNVVPYEDDEDDNGNPICHQYDNSGNLVGSCLRLIDSERSPSISL